MMNNSLIIKIVGSIIITMILFSFTPFISAAESQVETEIIYTDNDGRQYEHFGYRAPEVITMTVGGQDPQQLIRDSMSDRFAESWDNRIYNTVRLLNLNHVDYDPSTVIMYEGYGKKVDFYTEAVRLPGFAGSAKIWTSSAVNKDAQDYVRLSDIFAYYPDLFGVELRDGDSLAAIFVYDSPTHEFKLDAAQVDAYRRHISGDIYSYVVNTRLWNQMVRQIEQMRQN